MTKFLIGKEHKLLNKYCPEVIVLAEAEKCWKKLFLLIKQPEARSGVLDIQYYVNKLVWSKRGS